MFALARSNFKRDMIYKLMSKCMISGFRREVDENCALLPYYAPSGGDYSASSGNYSASSGNFVNTANLVHNFFIVFISFLYMFRATMCPSSGETTVFMRHLVLDILNG